MRMCDGMRVSVHSYINGHNEALEHTCVRVSAYRAEENPKKAGGTKVFLAKARTSFFITCQF